MKQTNRDESVTARTYDGVPASTSPAGRRLAANLAANGITAAIVGILSVLLLDGPQSAAARSLALLFALCTAPSFVAEHASTTPVGTAEASAWARRAFQTAVFVAVAAVLAVAQLRAQTAVTLAAWTAAVAATWMSAALRGSAQGSNARAQVRAAYWARHGVTIAVLLATSELGITAAVFALLAGALGELVVLAQATAPVSAGRPDNIVTTRFVAAAGLLWATPAVDVLASVHVLDTPHYYNLSAALPRAAAIVAGLVASTKPIELFSAMPHATSALRSARFRAFWPSFVAAIVASSVSVVFASTPVALAAVSVLTAVVAVQVLVCGSWALIHCTRTILVPATVAVGAAAGLFAYTPVSQLTLALIALATTTFAFAVLHSATNAVARHRARPALTGDLSVSQWDRVTSVSVVLPAYNPGVRLLPTIEKVHAAFADVAHEVIVVDDGSSDGSCDFDPLVEDVVLVQKANGGKGSALAVGLVRARGEWLAFVDSDGDIDPAHLRTYFDLAVSSGVDGVVGSKRANGSHIDVTGVRRMLSWGFQTIVQLMLRTSIRDTQVGCKVVRGDVMRRTLPHMTETGFLFDLELLALLAQQRTRLVEAPVRIEERAASTVTGRTVLTMLRGTLVLGVSNARRDDRAATRTVPVRMRSPHHSPI